MHVDLVLKAAGGLLSVGSVVAVVGGSNTDILLGSVLGAVGATGLALLGQILNRAKRLILFLLDKGFDKVEKKVGMDPTDFEDKEPPDEK